VASGSVITQSPLGGASVPNGSAVALTVSLGRSFVPNVVGANPGKRDVVDHGWRA